MKALSVLNLLMSGERRKGRKAGAVGIPIPAGNTGVLHVGPKGSGE